MKRRIFTFLSVVSLTLLVVIAGSWVISFWYKCGTGFNAGGDMWAVVVHRGKMEAKTYIKPVQQGNRINKTNLDLHFLGFAYKKDPFYIISLSPPPRRLIPLSHAHVVTIPHWFVALLTAVLPVWWLLTFRRRSLAQYGLCVKCGYDLRASRDRCPECGTEIPAASKTAKTPRTVKMSF